MSFHSEDSNALILEQCVSLVSKYGKHFLKVFREAILALERHEDKLVILLYICMIDKQELVTMFSFMSILVNL